MLAIILLKIFGPYLPVFSIRSKDGESAEWDAGKPCEARNSA
jgi:hypothetical protein